MSPTRVLLYCAAFLLTLGGAYFAYFAFTFHRTWVRPDDVHVVSSFVGLPFESCFMVDIQKSALQGSGHTSYGVIGRLQEEDLLEHGWERKYGNKPFHGGSNMKLLSSFYEYYFTKITNGYEVFILLTPLSDEGSILFITIY